MEEVDWVVFERRNAPAFGISEPEGSAILYRNVFAAVDAAPTAPVGPVPPVQPVGPVCPTGPVSPFFP